MLFQTDGNYLIENAFPISSFVSAKFVSASVILVFWQKLTLFQAEYKGCA